MLTQGWGDFIAWLEGHQASAEVFVAIAALIVTAALVGVTITYVRAARRQADASTKMAQEAREQRLSGVQALILLQHGSHEDLGTKICVRFRLMNEGNGPAMAVTRVVRHPNLLRGTGEHVREWQAITEPLCDDTFELSRQLPSQPTPGVIRVDWSDIYRRARWCQLPFTARLDGERVVVEWGQLELSAGEGGG